MLRTYSWTVVNHHPKHPLWTGDLDCRDVGREIIIHCYKQNEDTYIVGIEAPDYESAYREMRGQISDGLFENDDVTEYPNFY